MSTHTFSCFMCLSSRNSLYVLLAWMMDWNGLESFFTATFKPIFSSTAELQRTKDPWLLHQIYSLLNKLTNSTPPSASAVTQPWCNYIFYDILNIISKHWMHGGCLILKQEDQVPINRVNLFYFSRFIRILMAHI